MHLSVPVLSTLATTLALSALALIYGLRGRKVTDLVGRTSGAFLALAFLANDATFAVFRYWGIAYIPIREFILPGASVYQVVISVRRMLGGSTWADRAVAAMGILVAPAVVWLCWFHDFVLFLPHP